LFLTFDDVFQSKRKNIWWAFYNINYPNHIIYVIYEKKRNMNKTFKLVLAIILFIFLLFITKEVFSAPLPPVYTITSIKCISSNDCPDCVIEPGYITNICESGYCLKLRE
jgi:TRAP-type uncharacterized transport system fused permease subunit